MSFAQNQDQAALADATAKFAARHGSLADVRNGPSADTISRASWQPLVDQSLHAVHLEESVGGQGGSLSDLAVVVAELGRNLVPGAFLPTVIASAIVHYAEGPAAEKAELRFAEGARGAARWADCGLVAQRVAEGWYLEGEVGPTPGAGAAELLVVSADCEGMRRWFVIDADHPGVVTTTVEGVDLTRDLAEVRFASVRVGPDHELRALDADLVRSVASALIAVEASGVIEACYEATIDYLKTRHQFGRPIGSFQALQHRAAQLCITSELATAAAWDAIRALSDDPHQRTHGVQGATVMSTARAVHAAVEALCMHGAIGFSWEHDLHLYWRRAISLAAMVGPRSVVVRELGEAALEGPRRFQFDLAGERPEFRAEIATVLDEAARLENHDPSPAAANDGVARGERRTLLAKSGLVGPHLPRPYGRGADPTEQLIIREEFATRGIEQPSMVIGEWVLPVVLSRGTPAQIERVVGPTMRGETLWCQLFSEPGAGSDMAAVALKATPTTGGWTLSGQKIWTTMAHIADWGLCLARTDTEVKKHLGLSMFIIDMNSPGIEVRPIKQANGAAEFNEVFFNDVFVPDEMLIGKPGDGWSLMIDTISQERLFIGSFAETGHEQRIRDLVNDGRFAGARDAALEGLGEVSAFGAAIGAMNMRETLRRLDGEQPGASVSIAKAAAAQLHARAAAVAVDLVGEQALLSERRCEPVFNELDIPTWIVGGGTLEIQLNAIASFVIGLPRG